jgi:hypothetical protein
MLAASETAMPSKKASHTPKRARRLLSVPRPGLEPAQNLA